MPPRLELRRFRPSDQDRIDAIESAAFGNDAYERNLFAEFYHKCGDLFLVCLRRGILCGYIVTCIRGERAELVSIAVAPNTRRHGIASALLESTLRRLRRRHMPRLILMVRETNAPARRFYEKYAFKKVRIVRRYYEDGSDGILMSRQV
jgi:ribosomal-protein-alanine N-acetyltransferase